MQRRNKVRFLYKYSVPEENSVFGEVSHWEEEGGRGGAGGRLFEAGCLSTFSAFRMGGYSRWALVRGRVLFRINTVITFFYFTAECHQL